jgi:hypothetical protein
MGQGVVVEAGRKGGTAIRRPTHAGTLTRMRDRLRQLRRADRSLTATRGGYHASARADVKPR